MRLLGGVRLWRERDSIVNTGNFNPEHSVFVLKMFYLYPIVTKASSSAMDVDAYWVYGFQAATDYVLQMTPLGGVGNPWLHAALRVRAPASRSPQGELCKCLPHWCGQPRF